MTIITEEVLYKFCTLDYFLEVPDSNKGRGTCYPGIQIMWVSSYSPENSRVDTSVNDDRFSSTFSQLMIASLCNLALYGFAVEIILLKCKNKSNNEICHRNTLLVYGVLLRN